MPNVIPRPLSVWAASAPSRVRRGDEVVNDDRSVVDDAHGLWLACDASGPTDGGYHAPFAAGPGIAALAASFASAEGTMVARLRAALRSAHVLMKAAHQQHEDARQGQQQLGFSAARAALAAADAVRPPAWERWQGRSFAHFAASVTACAVGDGSLVIAQIGTCRAYGSDGQTIHLLVPERMAPDPTLPSPSLLGIDESAASVIEIAPPAAIVLCTDGIHLDEARVRALFDARSRDDVGRIVDRAAAEGGDDATAVVLRF